MPHGHLAAPERIPSHGPDRFDAGSFPSRAGRLLPGYPVISGDPNRPVGTPAPSTPLRCGCCWEDRALDITSIDSPAGRTPSLVEVSYRCTRCGVLCTREADVKEVARVLNRPGYTSSDVLAIVGRYIHCGQPMKAAGAEIRTIRTTFEEDRAPRHWPSTSPPACCAVLVDSRSKFPTRAVEPDGPRQGSKSGDAPSPRPAQQPESGYRAAGRGSPSRPAARCRYSRQRRLSFVLTPTCRGWGPGRPVRRCRRHRGLRRLGCGPVRAGARSARGGAGPVRDAPILSGAAR